ncbi:S8 family peptidase [Micromonospora sp. NBC_01699]|uniref:S8 family peptidase n=1 Tax=Micromonospora sp. NBC_01699 TaxID=2975984 RepID=UPI002E30C339|nr:S8 family peptidase [Micromonospora sp. NBC_01699]
MSDSQQPGSGTGPAGTERRPDRRRWRAGASVALSIALAAGGLAAPGVAGAAPGRVAGPAPLVAATGDTIPGSYVVVLAGKPGTADAARAGAAVSRAAALGVSIEHRYAAALNGFSARLTPAQVAALRDDPAVAYLAPNQRVGIDVAQTPATWGIDRVDQRNLPLDNTYNYDQTGTGVTAYVIDTGIRSTHAEFGGRVFPGYTAVSDGNGVNDCNGHGTHVAGTIGSTTYGVAKAVRLVPVRVLDCFGSGTAASVIAGIDWVTFNHSGPSVANMSLGGGAYQPIDDAVTNSINSGVTYVVAAGNNNGDACALSPARTPTAITVGASTSADSRDTTYSNWGGCLDLFAPGTAITSTWSFADSAINTISGTSMASPHVAGAAALYLSTHPTATPATVTSWILGRATPNVLSNVGTGSPNLLLYTGAVAASHAGMTWRVLEQRADNVVRVGADALTNAYQGDTPASAALPLLCLSVTGAPLPAGIVTDQYAGWSSGSVRITAPVLGSQLTSLGAADAICVANFGAGWRMAEFHDGIYTIGRFRARSGWSFWANGTPAANTRFWTHINDQPANPWS